jgi:nitroreductase
MNAVIENIKSRRSIREYKDKKIPKNLVKDIIEAGRYAPSSHNSQPWRFVVIEDKSVIKDLSDYIKIWFQKKLLFGKIAGLFHPRIKSEINSAKKRLLTDKDLFFYGAPLLVLVCAKPGRFSIQDCSLASQNMMLAARSYGIGSCWIGFADLVVNKGRRLMSKLGVPKGYKIMAHLIFGYAVKFPDKAYPRKEEADVVKWI